MPRYISHDSELYQSLFDQQEMKSLGLDLAKSPAQALSEGLGQGHHLRPARRRPRRAVLPAAADGRRPGRRQPDDVAHAAEADAVPARGVRRLPGVLPGRPDHLLHVAGHPAHRSAGLHHSTLLRARGGARPPGPASRAKRPASWPRSRGAAEASSRRPDAISRRPRAATRRRTGKPPTRRPAGGQPGRHLEAHDTTEEPPDPDGQGLRGTPGVIIGSPRWQSSEERRETSPMSDGRRRRPAPERRR